MRKQPNGIGAGPNALGPGADDSLISSVVQLRTGPSEGALHWCQQTAGQTLAQSETQRGHLFCPDKMTTPTPQLSHKEERIEGEK